MGSGRTYGMAADLIELASFGFRVAFYLRHGGSHEAADGGFVDKSESGCAIQAVKIALVAHCVRLDDIARRGVMEAGARPAA